MKFFPSDRKGPFNTQVHYTTEEVDRICCEELKSVELLPTKPGPIRIERFIEKRFNTKVVYKDLGDNILGCTTFSKSGVDAVLISTKFDDEDTKSSQRRLRSTLAHEAGHCLLHTHIICDPFFVVPEHGFSTDAGITPLCRETIIESRQYNGDWWEYQANMAIGSLLLPKNLVFVALDDFLERDGLRKPKTLNISRKNEAIQLCSDVFDVNPVVAQIRIDKLWP